MRIRVRELRMQKGISIRELSKLAGISKGSVENMESESPNPHLRTLCKVAEALNVKLLELIDEEE